MPFYLSGRRAMGVAVSSGTAARYCVPQRNYRGGHSRSSRMRRRSRVSGNSHTASALVCAPLLLPGAQGAKLLLGQRHPRQPLVSRRWRVSGELRWG